MKKNYKNWNPKEIRIPAPKLKQFHIDYEVEIQIEED